MGDANELRNRIAFLRSARLDGMTVGELQARLRELGQLESEMARMGPQSIAEAPRQAVTETASQEAPVPVAVPEASLKKDAGLAAAKEKKPKMTETEVGRYVMTVLAAALCLLAFAVFILSFWAAMPDMLKFLIAAGLGTGLWALGDVFSRKGRMLAFWLGIAGLGAGLAFIDVMAGTFAWYLYGPGIAGFLAAAWVLANFYLAQSGHHGMFHVIGYIGGFIALSMGKGMLFQDTASVLLLSGLAFAVSLPGLFGWVREKKQWLLILNIVFDLAACLVLSAPSYDHGTGIADTLPVQGWYALCLAGLALYLNRHVKDVPSWNRMGFAPRAVLALASAICAGFLDSCLGLPDGYGFLAVSCAALVFAIGSGAGYLLGVALPVYGFLASSSGTLTWTETVKEGFTGTYYLSCRALFPALCALGMCGLYRCVKHKPDKLGAILFYLAALLAVMDPPYGAIKPAYGLSMACLLTGLCLWLYQCQMFEGLWLCRPLERLGACMVPGLLLVCPADMGTLPGAVAAAIVTLGLQGYWVFYLKDNATEYGSTAAKVLWYIFRFLAYGAVLASCIFADDFTKGVVTVSLTVTLAFHISRMVLTEDKLEPVVSCLLANWHLIAVSAIWDLDSAVLVGVLNIAVSAVFIVIGFLWQKKGARKAGLGCAVAFALKLGLIDAAGGTTLGVAGGLLLAGAICFGVSILYNRLGKAYEEKD